MPNEARSSSISQPPLASPVTIHRAGAARLGPDLAKLKTKLTAEQLVDSILRPSKLIDKEFAQVSVLTVDGKVQTGIRISESEKEIVLRNLAEPEPINDRAGGRRRRHGVEGFVDARKFDQAAEEPQGVRRPDEVHHRNQKAVTLGVSTDSHAEFLVRITPRCSLTTSSIATNIWQSI